MNQKTTIWEHTSEGLRKIDELANLPYGIPAMGQEVNTTEYGVVQCSGIKTSGSGLNETICEVKLTIC